MQSSLLTTGYHLSKILPSIEYLTNETNLYSLFKNPPHGYKPFVRWWWNGDKVEQHELARELRLLKDAGIGGVEINPVKFPSRTDDLGKPSLQWLSEEWLDLLKFTFSEAKSLGITCDLIVGSGWPLGGEWLEGEERSQVVVVGTKKLEGPADYEASLFALFKEADPAISSPFPGREMEMLAVKLVPALLNNMGDVQDLTDQIPNGVVKCKIPEGKYVLYALVKINGFMEVIQGAPGATGPVLNHYNETAVKKYLALMSDEMRKNLGSIASYIRALFSDSLELEGSNWCEDMLTEFQKRRGYDLMPFLPFVLYKIAGMGNTWVYDHGADHGPDFREMIQRMRYDFELTRTELLKERFVDRFIAWCKENKVQSRLQGYGRGYFPLEGTFEADIPECETWIRSGLGTQMDEKDYRVGRAYTMINKYVSSAAHLQGKKVISCEELTNIHSVFNETLELIKVAGDQSIISGSTHAVFHGFNYSPPEASFPGWVLYGTFISERNPWWPYFHLFARYKTRLFAVLQQAEMFGDIGILPAIPDLWSLYGAQNEPFPAVMYPPWQTLIWEVIHQNGSGCDYLSESVIRKAAVQNGFLRFGQRKYHTIILTAVETIEPATMKRLHDFVASGGRVFCIDVYPAKAPGWNNHEQHDSEVKNEVDKMKGYPDRFIFLKKPENDFVGWYKDIQEKYEITPYLKIDAPNSFVTQVRYQAKDAEIFMVINSHIHDSFKITVMPSPHVVSGKQPWLWDGETGERFRLQMDAGRIVLDMGPAESKLIVFDREKRGSTYKQPAERNSTSIELKNSWSLTGKHTDGTVMKTEMRDLNDLKEIPEWTRFSGTISYKTHFELEEKSKVEWMNMGKVFGVCELLVNGQNAGTKWYGRRIFNIGKLVKIGNNEIEFKVVTTMGNYLKSFTNNPVAQYWTNEGRTIQPLQSMGLLGPVTIY